MPFARRHSIFGIGVSVVCRMYTNSFVRTRAWLTHAISSGFFPVSSHREILAGWLIPSPRTGIIAYGWSCSRFEHVGSIQRWNRYTRKNHFQNTHAPHTASAVNQLRCNTKETTERWTNLATDSIEIHSVKLMRTKLEAKNCIQQCQVVVARSVHFEHSGVADLARANENFLPAMWSGCMYHTLRKGLEVSP